MKFSIAWVIALSSASGVAGDACYDFCKAKLGRICTKGSYCIEWIRCGAIFWTNASKRSTCQSTEGPGCNNHYPVHRSEAERSAQTRRVPSARTAPFSQVAAAAIARLSRAGAETSQSDSNAVSPLSGDASVDRRNKYVTRGSGKKSASDRPLTEEEAWYGLNALGQPFREDGARSDPVPKLRHLVPFPGSFTTSHGHVINPGKYPKTDAAKKAAAQVNAQRKPQASTGVNRSGSRLGGSNAPAPPRVREEIRNEIAAAAEGGLPQGPG